MEKLKSLEDDLVVLKQKIKDINKNYLESEINEIYVDAQRKQDEFESCKDKLKMVESKWNKVLQTNKLARDVHDHHMRNKKYILAAPFKKVMVVSDDIIARAEEYMKAQDKETNSDIDNHHARVGDSNNEDDAACIVNSQGEAIELGKYFKKEMVIQVIK